MSFSAAPTNGKSGQRNRPGSSAFRIGACRVEPDLNHISGPEGETVLEPKTMAVLVYLAERPGQVVRAEDMIDAIWAGRPMGENPVYRCISQLRRALGDDPRQPAYIATVSTKGYRLIAPVSLQTLDLPHSPPAADFAPGVVAGEAVPARAGWIPFTRRSLLPVVLLLPTALATGLWLSSRDVTAPLPATAPTMAVLPFDNRSGIREYNYFADGLSDEILHRLTRYRELRVIARDSSFAFKDSGIELPRIAQTLGVDYVLHGEVRLEDDRLWVKAALVDREGFQVWSETFERPTSEDLTVQDEIASAVAMRILPRIAASPADHPRTSFEAYQQYFIGRELLFRRPEGYQDATLHHLNRAIDIDPGFADAFAMRAIALVWRAQSPAFEAANLASAQRDIDRALALDPDSAQAHAAQGFLYLKMKPQDTVASEASLRRALALDPNLASAWNWLAISLRAAGRHQEADEALLSGARIDPLVPSIGANLADSRAKRGEFDAAERGLRQLLTVPQTTWLISDALIDLLFDTGRLAEALEEVRAFVLRFAEDDLVFIGAGKLQRIFATVGVWDRADHWRALGDRVSGTQPMVRLEWAAVDLETAYPGYAPSARAFERAIESAGWTLDQTPVSSRVIYGALLALTGEYQSTLVVLEPIIDPLTPTHYLGSGQDCNVRHALAWAWLQTGHAALAETLLKAQATLYHEELLGGRLKRSHDLFEYARNQVLLGETNQALDLLVQAEQAGWRGYYHILHDPRWAALKEEERFQELMARIKGQLDEQRARIESLDADTAFGERLERLIASKTGELKRR